MFKFFNFENQLRRGINALDNENKFCLIELEKRYRILSRFYYLPLGILIFSSILMLVFSNFNFYFENSIFNFKFFEIHMVINLLLLLGQMFGNIYYAFSKYIVYRVKIFNFLLAYAIVIITSANIYYYTYISNPNNSFSEKDLGNLDFYYYSLSIITTLGTDLMNVKIHTFAYYTTFIELFLGVVLLGTIGISIIFSSKNNDKEILDGLKKILNSFENKEEKKVYKIIIEKIK